MCKDHTLNTERVENNVQKVIKSYIACKDYFHELKSGPKIVQKTNFKTSKEISYTKWI